MGLYTKIYHDVLIEFGLNLNEYFVMDTIANLSGAGDFCRLSNARLSEITGLSKNYMQQTILKLVALNLLELHQGYSVQAIDKKPSELWLTKVQEAEANIGKAGIKKPIKSRTKKVHTDTKKAPTDTKNVSHLHKKCITTDTENVPLYNTKVYTEVNTLPKDNKLSLGEARKFEANDWDYFDELCDKMQWLKLKGFQNDKKPTKQKIAEKRKEFGEEVFDAALSKMNRHCIINPTYSLLPKPKNLILCFYNFLDTDPKVLAAQNIYSAFWQMNFKEPKTGFSKSENSSLMKIIERLQLSNTYNNKPKQDDTVLLDALLRKLPAMWLTPEGCKLGFLYADLDNIIAAMRAPAATVPQDRKTQAKTELTTLGFDASEIAAICSERTRARTDLIAIAQRISSAGAGFPVKRYFELTKVLRPEIV